MRTWCWESVGGPVDRVGGEGGGGGASLGHLVNLTTLLGVLVISVLADGFTGVVVDHDQGLQLGGL